MGAWEGEAPSHPAGAMLQPEPEPEPTIVGRYATLTGVRASDVAAGVGYAEGGAFDSVSLGPASTPLEHNSVLLLPNLLSEDECAQLIADAERRHAQQQSAGEAEADGAWSRSSFGDAPAEGFERHRIPMLSSETNALFEEVLRERLLPLLSQQLPALEAYAWARSERVCRDKRPPSPPPERPREPTSLGRLPLRFALQEPAINRYAEGGSFAPHRDQQALTLNVLLRSGSFDGGGTAFWREDDDQGPGGEGSTSRPTVTVQPAAAGCGVVFNGTVRHAGRAVARGLRHVLVASFSITNAEYVSATAKKSRRYWIGNGG